MSFTTAGPSCSRWSDVWLAAAARGVSTCGDFLAATALALALQSAGAGGLAVSGLLLAATLPLVVLAPLTGRLADRVDSRTLLIGAGVAQAATCAALAYAEHPALIIGLVTLLACGLAVTQPNLAALVPAMVRAVDLPRASAVNQTAGTLGALVGPALAGLLVGQFGVRPPLLLDAASYLALVVAGLLLRTRRGGARSSATAQPTATTQPTGTAQLAASDGSPARATAATWRLRHDPLLLGMVAAMAGALAAVMAMTPVEVFFMRETLGSSTITYGIVTGAWTAGVLPGAWLFARLTHRLADDGALVRAALVLLGGCCLMVLAGATVPNAQLLVPLWLIGGLCNGGDNVFSNVVLARRVPEAARGRAFAALGAAIQGASMIGFLIGGLLLEFFAPRPLIAAAGLAGLLVIVALWVPVARIVRRERSVRQGAVNAGLATPVPAR
ncbi:MFS transporter [Micromonospora sp. CPCC 206060]|uniref:MFS transporter n=1 Tax=Micromonospora sp. CPCC 206060 TaxID=3122406 RepID=UPI002FEF7368